MMCMDTFLRSTDLKYGISLQTRSLFDAIWYNETSASTVAMEILQRCEDSAIIPVEATHDTLLLVVHNYFITHTLRNASDYFYSHYNLWYLTRFLEKQAPPF